MSPRSPVAELLLAVLPITGLENIDCKGKRLLLVGKGCFLDIIDAQSHKPLGGGPVLSRQAIHGIVQIQSQGNENSETNIHILVYGGTQIAWVKIDLTAIDQVPPRCICVLHTITVKDWILCCKSAGDAFFGASFVTSYNALYSVEANVTTEQLNCSLMSDEVGTFLYSADLVQRSNDSYIVASGTVFGEVLIWICTFEAHNKSWKTKRSIRFEGHHGSIFGVCISEPYMIDREEHRLVASCSDDRMIHLWDFPFNKFDTGRSIEGTSSEFWQNGQALTRVYAHMSRIWSVDIPQMTRNDSDKTLLFSTGEDGQIQSWALDLNFYSRRAPPVLQNRYADRHHAGKNIWARCYLRQENMTTFWTGGADGQIVARKYDSAGIANHRSRSYKASFASVYSKICGSNSAKKSSFAFKTYLGLSHGRMLATTDTGHLLYGDSVFGEDMAWRVIVSDTKNILLISATDIDCCYAFFIRQSDFMLCALRYDDFTLTDVCSISQARIADIWMSTSGMKSPQNVCIAISFYDRESLELIWLNAHENEIVMKNTSSLLLPSTFDVTSVLYDEDEKSLLCGSRAGALAVYTDLSSSTDSSRFQLCYRHVHGQDTVTSIHKLEGAHDCQEYSFYLTTGRDGTYCVHKLEMDTKNEPILTTVHQATPPIGPQIEGAHICTLPNGDRKILLHGFRSKNFVVWNETDQTQVMNVDCGGAHRSWNFGLDKQTAQGGTFIWTKAGTFALYQQEVLDHEILQSGGHGREIKALAVHRLDHEKWLLATGSEDTDIRLFECTSTTLGRLSSKNVSVIRKHTTGLQSLQFSPNGKTLLSAAGMEELFAWKLSPVPVLGQGVVFACALTSIETHSDARIMSFDMCIHPNFRVSSNPDYVLAVAFSNGRLKIVQLHASTSETKAHFEILQQIDFGTICLTQAHLSNIDTEQHCFSATIAATNGFTTSYNIPSLNFDSTNSMVSASSITATKGSDQTRYRIHQNSITALQVLRLTRSHQIIVSGGDDNALAITMITTSPSLQTGDQHQQEIPRFKSIIIPNAHAAALTALQVIPARHQSLPKALQLNAEVPRQLNRTYTVITAGNDQSIQIWTLKINIDMLQRSGAASEMMDEVQIEWLGEWYTNVADISDLRVLSGYSEDERAEERLGENTDESDADYIDVLVVGVGMEVLRLRRPEYG